MSELRQKTVSGIAWSTISRGGQQVLKFMIGVLLVRLLSPSEFGLIAMITAITGFAVLFTGLGFGVALIQKQEVRQEHLSSIFWLNLICGILLMAVFAVGSPLIANFYQQPILVPLTILISTDFFIQSLNIIHRALIIKSLNFRTLSIVMTATTALSGAVAIVMAYAGCGVWSLAAQVVVGSIVEVVLLWHLNDWRPALMFRWRAVRELMSFSLNYQGSRTLTYWASNCDNILIGRFVGTAALGVYGRAYSVMLLPMANVSQTVLGVLLPSFSIIQTDRPRIGQVYLRISRTIALIAFPLMLGLIVTATPFVLSVFGSQWADMIPILQILSVVGLIQSVSSLNSSLYLSQGRTDLELKVSLVLRATQILGIVIGLRWGVIGVALSLVITSLMSLFVNFFFSGRLVSLTFSEYLRNFAGVACCALAMALLVWIIGFLLPTNWPPLAYLVAQGLLGVVVYFALIHSFKVQAYQDVRMLVAEQWQLHHRQWRIPLKKFVGSEQ